jgi:hypothetical protein
LWGGEPNEDDEQEDDVRRPAPWAMKTKDCIRIDKKMESVIGAKGEELPFKVIKKGHARNTHDTIFWASTYANWCLSGEGSTAHTNNILELFDIISQLNGSRHKVEGNDVLFDKVVKNLVEKSGLFPSTECTTALHELIHIADQILITGPPRYSNLFKFERANHFLKQLLQNAKHGLPSIFKNYLISEHMALCVGTSFHNMSTLTKLFRCMPTDLNIFSHGPSYYLRSMHVDYNVDPVTGS